MAPVTSKVLGSGQSPENMLVFEAHAVARVILIWVACAIPWGHGDLPAYLGPCSCCNWGVCWYPWPVLQQWVIGSLCVELRGLCWADPTIHCPWHSWSCSLLHPVAGELVLPSWESWTLYLGEVVPLFKIDSWTFYSSEVPMWWTVLNLVY